ncbi:MerR family transcriptional regulator [Streptosporangiaceae bacterium NEAU-GS5]|nr:MerR family transcriptional regulator [Streptosporangiaceae bacterium NEAU-GS5]
MDGTWTIGELAEQAARLLGSATQSNGRVRDVPNERLIRWYVTIGLLDPPLARRGRIALYGPRHLLQLVAVKRRQAAGASIADIQAELTGAPNATLEAIATVPSPSPEPPPEAAPRFWTAAARSTEDIPKTVEPVARVHGVRLAPGVTLLLDDAARVPTDGDLGRLAEAAEPLLLRLAELRLLRTRK